MVVAFLGFGLNPDKAMTFGLPLPLELVHKSGTFTETSSGEIVPHTQIVSGSSFNCDSTSLTQNQNEFCGNTVNPDILCHVKITTDVIDENGKVIASEQSAFFVGNPITTFSFTDVKTKDTVAGFHVTPKIKCDTPDTRDLFDFGQVPITVKSNDMVVKVFSVAQDGKHLTETYNDKFTTKEVKLNNNQEQTMTVNPVSINADDIVGAMENGTYDSYQHIVVEGDINIYWTGYPSVVYRLTADTEKTHNADGEIVKVESELITFREITVDKVAESTGEQIECETGEYAKGGVCVSLIDDRPTENPLNNLSGSIVTDFVTCAFGSENKSCLVSSSFSPLYLIGVGAVALIIASRPAPRQQIYGLP